MLFLRSIRGRFLLWLALLLTCVLTAFGVVAHRLRQASVLEKVDEDLERQLSLVSGALRGPPGGRDGSGGRDGHDRPGGPGNRENRENRGPGGPPPGDEHRGGPRSRGREEPPLEPPDDRGFSEHRGTETRGGPGPRGGGPGEPPRGQRPPFLPPAALAAQFDPNDVRTPFFMIAPASGRLLGAGGKLPPGAEMPQREGNDLSLHRRTRGELREIWQFTEMGDGILVGRSLAHAIAAGRKFAWLLAAAGGGVLLLALGGGWWLVASALRPVQAISATATRIAAGDLTDRIDATDTETELGRLAEVLNGTFARLEAAFVRQRQFTADASHELRTPLAVLISETQGTLARPRTAAEYREAIETCLDTAQQMRRLTESLLTLARFDNAQIPCDRRPVDLAALATTVAERLRPFAAERRLTLRLELTPASAHGDPVQLQQVLTNLLSNAIQYTFSGEPITIMTDTVGESARLSVIDGGIGISPEDLPHVFERFFRADRARARADGHTGLGLAICQAIVESHAGEISVTSEFGQGSTFTVLIPATSDPPALPAPPPDVVPAQTAARPPSRLEWPPT